MAEVTVGAIIDEEFQDKGKANSTIDVFWYNLPMMWHVLPTRQKMKIFCNLCPPVFLTACRMQGTLMNANIYVWIVYFY